MQGTWIRSLARELRSHMLQSNKDLIQSNKYFKEKKNPWEPQYVNTEPLCLKDRGRWAEALLHPYLASLLLHPYYGNFSDSCMAQNTKECRLKEHQSVWSVSLDLLYKTNVPLVMFNKWYKVIYRHLDAGKNVINLLTPDCTQVGFPLVIRWQAPRIWVGQALEKRKKESLPFCKDPKLLLVPFFSPKSNGSFYFSIFSKTGITREKIRFLNIQNTIHKIWKVYSSGRNQRCEDIMRAFIHSLIEVKTSCS